MKKKLTTSLVCLQACSLVIAESEHKSQTPAPAVHLAIYNTSGATNQQRSHSEQKSMQNHNQSESQVAPLQPGFDEKKSMPTPAFLAWTVIKMLPIHVAAQMTRSYLFPLYVVNRCIVYPLAQYLYGQKEEPEKNEQGQLVLTPNFFVFYPIVHNVKLLLLSAYARSTNYCNKEQVALAQQEGKEIKG